MLHRHVKNGRVVTSVTGTFDAYVGKVMFVSLGRSATSTYLSSHSPAS